MKYIRTKDFVVELEPWMKIDKEILIIGGATHKIVKQANTIEELCDGFIFKDTKANELHFLNENDGISLLGAALFTETVRGYIETNEGLIYVAKMNEKGELELL